MATISDKSFMLAIGNVAHHGDTDIFPFPIENHFFHDKPLEVLKALQGVDEAFEESIAKIPVLNCKELTPASYSGFRQGTLIDPLWNAYLLALVIEAGADIEAKRVSNTVSFAYRFAPDHTEFTLFDKDIGWSKFRGSIKATAPDFQFVLRCDISDFYPRIYHHRLENALQRAVKNTDISKRIIKLVSEIAGGPSYGLPVGGNAARLLSELLLNQVDRLLATEGVKFYRFVDDYVIFANTREEAQSALISLTKFLLTNEGLSLQKSKTKIMSAAEFLLSSDLVDEVEGNSPEAEKERAFRKLRIHYDPYAQTAKEDYEALANELTKYDIVGMLGRELTKSRVDEGLTKRLITAVKLLEQTVQNEAVRSMANNLHLLYPIFPHVMRVCKSLLPSLEGKVKDELFSALRDLIKNNSYITQVTNNLAFALRVLAYDYSDETEAILANCYKQSESMMIKREIILMMAHRNADHWTSHCKNSYATLTDWEKRSFLIASYTLGDEGKHWRDSVKKDLNTFDRALMVWGGESKNAQGSTWRVPV